MSFKKINTFAFKIALFYGIPLIGVWVYFSDNEIISFVLTPLVTITMAILFPNALLMLGSKIYENREWFKPKLR